MRLNAIGTALAANIVLAGALGYLWSDDERGRWKEPEALPASLDEIRGASTAEPIDLSKYRETLERPLFAWTRKRAQRADQAEALATEDALKDVRLLGTYGVGQRGGIIVLSGGQVLRLAVGESVRGWKVASPGAGRSAELVRADGQHRRLELPLNIEAPPAAAALGAAKEGEKEAQAAPATDQVRAPAAAAAQSQRGAPSRGSTLSAAEIEKVREERRRQRMDRINERRAAKGLPRIESTK